MNRVGYYMLLLLSVFVLFVLLSLFLLTLNSLRFISPRTHTHTRELPGPRPVSFSFDAKSRDIIFNPRQFKLLYLAGNRFVADDGVDFE